MPEAGAGAGGGRGVKSGSRLVVGAIIAYLVFWWRSFAGEIAFLRCVSVIGCNMFRPSWCLSDGFCRRRGWLVKFSMFVVGPCEAMLLFTGARLRMRVKLLMAT